MPLEDEHIAYIWAAYKRGALAEFSALPEGLSPERFREHLFAFVGRTLESGGEIWIALKPTENEQIPVGMFIGFINSWYMEPHWYWFPEASARNRLEVTLRFLIDMKERFKLIVWVAESDWPFFDHLCKYGVIRTVGKYRKFLPDDRDAFLFQGVT